MFRKNSTESHQHASKTESFIRECPQFRELLNHCSFDSLAAVDLDNSTLRPTRMEDLASDQWFREVLKRAQQNLDDPTQAILSAVKLNNSVLPLIKVKSVEPDTAHIVKLLQDLKLPVIAVTARRYDVAEATSKQLHDINIHFTNFDTEIEFRLASCPDKRILFKDGVLYCDGANKGECLLQLLRILKIAVSKIVMLDDSEKNLLQAKDAMEANHLSFVGLRYNRLDQRAANHEFKRSNKKLSEVSSLFSRSVVNIITTLKLTDDELSIKPPSTPDML